MGKIYIGSSLYNADAVRKMRDLIIAAGHTVTYDWTTHGKVHSHEDLRKYGEEELKGVKDCDVFLMLQPSRFGTHIELGIALADHKPVVMVVDPDSEPKTFYFMNNVYRVFDDIEAFSKTLEILRGQLS